MKISVTKDDINVGRRCSKHHCPVAIAIVRASKMHASVGTNNIYVYDGARDAAYVPSKDVVTFILDFDSGRVVAPFEFDLGD